MRVGILNQNIPAFVFSKNRAMQLDSLLNSFKLNCDMLFNPIYILWKSTNGCFASGYDKLINKYLKNKFTSKLEQRYWFVEEQKDMKSELNTALDFCSSYGNLCTIFTDDCIFYRKFSDVNNTTKTIHQVFIDLPRLLTFSWRLGKNCYVQDYRNNTSHPVIEPDQVIDNILVWNSRKYYHHLNPGYLFGQDGQTFLIKDLQYILDKFDTLTSMRDFEGCLSEISRQKLPKIGQTYIAAFDNSYVVNAPLNSVQDETLPTLVQEITPEHLNSKYLAGESIDLAGMDFTNIVGCHQNIPYKFTNKAD